MKRTCRTGIASWLGIIFALLLTASILPQTMADVRLPAIFSDHIVLQRDQADRVWGWADAGEQVKVILGEQKKTAQADAHGRWSVKLDAMPAGGPHQIVIEGKNRIEIQDVLFGEVWLCSGQSNMQFALNSGKDADLEKMTANYPKIRLITVPRVGTQEPQEDFKGQWQLCSPDTVGGFSAVGYLFGRQLYESVHVPIGLINNSWGGSSCEAWIRRDLLAQDPIYQPMLDRWAETEKTYDPEKDQADYQERLEAWKVKASAARQAGKPAPRRPRAPSNPLVGQHRPANLYNGVLKPLIGYGIRGVIWYQGESNASRAYQYRKMFPLMISSWRDEWHQGDFPFFWVQLADFKAETTVPQESDWAELREAQTMTLSLPKTGQAVIIDIGDASDIHPKDKQDVGKRLSRWALGTVYGVDLVYRSPEYQSMERDGNHIVITFQHVDQGLRTVDANTIQGFTIAGADKQFVNANAKIVGKNKVEVWSDEVSEPVAVRYAWADNPICNLYNQTLLPVTPFRTDDWPGKTINER